MKVFWILGVLGMTVFAACDRGVGGGTVTAASCEQLMRDDPAAMQAMMGSMMGDSGMRGRMMGMMMENAEMRGMMMERMMQDSSARGRMMEMMGGMEGMGGMPADTTR
jgi:hypothetical protein